ncbi:hypothetical protein KFK09_009601 [Dendrobium nobile]|uniref:DUF4283 domain-containing protein n=1 Tax=Dendrobium nobile TaxID=94219 RepID=A0A8T3BN76_DENNO|nr:hypothetical protein KFK09_009601 [Dendrobium nobile]
MSSSNAWGKVSSPTHGKSIGFFDLDGDAPTTSPSRSFKDVLPGNPMQGDNVPKFTQSVVNGVPAVRISDEDVLKIASPFQFTLVGKFALRRPNLDSIRSFFANLKLSGFYSVGLLNFRHVAIQLSNDLDYSRVFARISYFISNCQMRILKWMPFFDVHEESPIVSIWISFPNLRLHFFNPQVLHVFGSIFGRPLQTDQVTESRTRPSVARVLVEVDISKKHPKEVWVGLKAFGYLQKVEFEKVSDFCSHCKIHSHAISNCFKLHPELKKSSKPSVEKVDSPVNSISHNVLDKVVSNAIIENQVDAVTSSIMSENRGDLENIYVSIDSMLQNSMNVPLVAPDTNLVINLDSEINENCEEGEFIPTQNKKDKLVQNLERGSSLPLDLQGSKSKKPAEDDSFFKILEEESFTKVNKKKGKNTKDYVSSTPFFTRAQTSAKGSHG